MKKASEMIREALAEGVSKPSEIQEWIKAKYSVEVAKGNINQTKQLEKKKAAERGEPATPTKATANGQSTPMKPEANGHDVKFSLAELQLMKALKERYGASSIAALLEIL